MIEVPDTIPPDRVGERLGARVVVISTPSVRERIARALPWPVLADDAPVPAEVDGVVVAGGGELIDRVKLLRLARPSLRIAALPTVWGSGAEASPIAIENTSAGKRFVVDRALRPDCIIAMPELARTVPAERARHACGDAWAHALEGFLSPLAGDSLRADLASVMLHMLTLPLAYDARWFAASATACAGQAQSSVGLVHGIAHTLEPLVPSSLRAHALLCSITLLPVMRFNERHSVKWPDLAAHGLSAGEIFTVLDQLFDRERYESLKAPLAANWMTVLRDPCTRTNAALVRPADLAFFEGFAA